jgi:predicted permease
MFLRRVFLKLWRRRRLQQDLEAELAFHRELAGRNNNPIPLGREARIRDESFEIWRFSLLEDTWRDARHAVRSLARIPGFTVIAILTLALGIGANTAIFSLLDRVMLESLAVQKPARLFEILSDRGSGTMGIAFSYQALQYFRTHARTSNVIAMATTDFHGLITGRSIERWLGQYVTGDYFTILGVNPAPGRLLVPDDDRADAANAVAVISYAMWQSRFGGGRDALGQTILVDNVPFQIVGVAPKEFQGLEVGRDIDLWIPLEVERRLRHPSWTSSSGHRWLQMIGRLDPGASIDQARAELRVFFNTAVVENDIAEHPNDEYTNQKIRGWSLALEPAGTGLSRTRNQFSRPLLVLLVIVTFLLLIACANVANLLLGRALAREKEMALRLSLGAGRGRLIRQLLTESALLGGAGGALGLAMAYRLNTYLTAFLSQNRTLVLDVSPNRTTLIFTAAITLCTVFLFGLMPAIRSTGLDLSSGIKGNPVRRKSSAGHGWSGRLIVVQVALLMVLVVGAGLFLRTLHNLNTVDLGFDRTNVLLAGVDTFGTNYSQEQLRRRSLQVLESIATLPSVRVVSWYEFPPISGGGGINWDFVIDDGRGPMTAHNANVNIVGPRYFAALETPFIAGRDFVPEDAVVVSHRVVIVNQSFVRRYFGGVNPVGRSITQRGQPLEIIGVVGDTKYEDVREAMVPTVFYDISPEGTAPHRFIIRTEGNSERLADAVRAETRSEIGNVSVNIRTLENQIDATIVRERLVASLAAIFGGMALVLAIVGLYGVVSHSVAQRTKEIGIRIALGLEPRRIVSMVVQEILVLTGCGIALGLVLAVLTTRFIGSLLYGLTPHDPLTTIAAVVVLLLSSLAGGLVPARRAARVDPLVAIRVD